MIYLYLLYHKKEIQLLQKVRVEAGTGTVIRIYGSAEPEPELEPK